jgi:hypothetical protein
MIYLPPIHQLSMYGVVDAGVPNRERICLRPTDTTNLAQFGILLATSRMEAGTQITTPFSGPHGTYFWFGDVIAEPPSWIIIFTGKGERVPPKVENAQKVFVFYWGLEFAVFAIPGAVPVLFRIDSILIGQNIPQKTAQIASHTGAAAQGKQ